MLRSKPMIAPTLALVWSILGLLLADLDSHTGWFDQLFGSLKKKTQIVLATAIAGPVVWLLAVIELARQRVP